MKSSVALLLLVVGLASATVNSTGWVFLNFFSYFSSLFPAFHPSDKVSQGGGGGSLFSNGVKT